MKLWICFCVLILICSVHFLFEEEFKVVYQSEEDSTARKMSYLICFDLKTTIPNYSNRTKIRMAELNQDLLEYFSNMSKSYLGKPADFRDLILNPLKTCDSLLSHLSDTEKNHTKKQTDLRNLILNPLKTCDYLLWNEDVCFNSRFVRSLLFEEKRFEKQLTLFAFNRATFTVIKLLNYRTHYIEELNLLKVVHKPHPYSNCREEFSRFGCLNECFKRRFRLSKYFYNFSERADLKEPIYLQYDNRNESIADNEKRCFDRCKFEDCNLIYFVYTIGYIYFRSASYRAYPVISRFEFWAQLAGLVTLICNISFYQLLSAVYILVARKARQERVKKLFFHLKMVALFLCVFYLSSVTLYMIADYQHKMENPARKETMLNLFKPEIFHFAVI